MDFKLYILVLLVLSGCNLYMDEEPDFLYYRNNSEKAIHIVANRNKADTIIPYFLCDGIYRCTVLPNETKNSFIELDYLYENDSISIFILDNDIVLNNSWNDIIKKRLFLCIYVLSKTDITKLSEKIKYPKLVEYPPTKEMKNMYIIK